MNISFQYDFIAKFETIDADLKYLFKKLDFGITWPKKEASTSADYMRLYYHGLKRSHLTELYKQYAADFEVINKFETFANI